MTVNKIVNRFANYLSPSLSITGLTCNEMMSYINEQATLNDDLRTILVTFIEALHLRSEIPEFKYFFHPAYNVSQHDKSVSMYCEYLDICHDLHELLKAYQPLEYGAYIHMATKLLNKVKYANH